MNLKTKSKRLPSKLLILPEFQLFILGSNLILVIAAIFAVWLSTKGMYSELHRMGIDAQFPSNHGYFKFLEYQQALFAKAILTCAVFTCVCVCISVLVISHKLAGPVVRLRNYLRRIPEINVVDIQPISFRKGDYIGDLPTILNKAIDHIKHNSNQPKNPESPQNK